MNKSIIGLTPFVGVALVFIGTLDVYGVVEISAQSLLGFSLAAFLFTLKDFLDVYFQLTSDKKRNHLLIFLSKNIKLPDYTFIIYLLAVFSIMIFPYLNIPSIRKYSISTLFNQSIVFYSLGFVIITIGFKEFMYRKKELDEHKKELEEVIKTHIELQTEIKSIKEEFKNKLHK